jgi:hypothetical protein
MHVQGAEPDGDRLAVPGAPFVVCDREGARGAERGPIVERTGRMTVSQPPLHFPRMERVDPRIL